MKILFDFLTLHTKNGAAEYTRRVFEALLHKIDSESLYSVSIHCLYDSIAEPAYSDLRPGNLNHERVQFVDIRKGISFINSQDYDVFFFGCAQNGGWHPELSLLVCKSIIVVHDCVWEEMYNNDIGIYQILNWEDIFRYREDKPYGKSVYFDVKGPTIRFCRWLLHSREHGVLEKGHDMLTPSLDLFRKREDNIILTVSNYSKSSIMYNFGIDDNRICVKYSPERIYIKSEDSQSQHINDELEGLINRGIKYYLIVSANRSTKNAKKALRAFKKFAGIRKDHHVVTIGFGKILFENHIDLPFLNDADLEIAYKSCYALLYPSLFEGFGYPPLEAMRFGKPILTSNVCSMPEVLGDAPIYFSPIYESAIFNALMSLNDENYSEYSVRSYNRYKTIHVKQEQDLFDLVNMIITPSSKYYG